MQIEQRRRGGVRHALRRQLAPDRPGVRLVELVDGDDGGAEVVVRHAAAVHQAREERARVQAHDEAVEAEIAECGRGGQDDLRLDGHRRRAEHVDVALHELAEAPVLRALGAPHRADLVALEHGRQRRAVRGVVARERDGQVEAQRQVGQLAIAGARPLQLRAALEDPEHQLLVLAAALAEEHRQALDRRRVHALEAERLVGLANPPDQLRALAVLIGQQVAEAARRGELCHGGPSLPRTRAAVHRGAPPGGSRRGRAARSRPRPPSRGAGSRASAAAPASQPR